jgi:hypothetical protein
MIGKLRPKDSTALAQPVSRHDAARPDTSRRIRERAVEYDRNLLAPEKREHGTYLDLDIVEEGCGRRPTRRGGPRFALDRDGMHKHLQHFLTTRRAE